VGELCDPNTIFNLILEISGTWKHNVQLNSPHINSWLPNNIWLEYFVNCQARKHPR